MNSWLFSLLKWPVSWIVKPTAIPDAPTTELDLDPGKPLVYAIQTDSSSDILALQKLCRSLSLPDPTDPLVHEGREVTRILPMESPESLFGSQPHPQPFREQAKALLELHQQDPSLDVQMLPVSMFWGRKPGKEKGTLRSLMAKRRSPSWLRKFFVVLFNGRDLFVRFSRPVSLRQMADQHGTDDTIAHKLVRVARVHFYRQRLAATGPRLAERKNIFRELRDAPAVAKAIQDEMDSKSRSRSDVEKRALKMMEEIAANYSTGLIELLDRFMTWLWSRIYNGINVSGAERIRELAQSGHELVYVPCHRSHMDYLLLSYVLYYEGLVPPHIAAGVNLNFWPAGPIFRRGGAFFMRRSFRGDKLYSAVFREYLVLLFQKGYPVEYFTEGGRSRTGRLLPPKTGMLAMTVQSMLRGLDRPVTLVPVYLGYEHVMEIGTYMRELKGKRKQKESVWQVMSAARKLRNFGLGYVNFGTPIPINEFLNKHAPDWRDSIDPLETQKPSWMTPVVNQLANAVMNNINRAAALNSISLSSLCLLCADQRSMTRPALERQMEFYLQLLREASFSEDITLPEESVGKLLDHALTLEKYQVEKDPLGDIISLDSKASVLMTYYRNNILHLVVLPSLFASAVRRHRRIAEDQVYQICREFYPLLDAELFLGIEDDQLSKYLTQIKQALVNQQLISEQDGWLKACDKHTPQFPQLVQLTAAVQEILGRYLVVLAHLDKHPSIERGQLESSSQTLAQRLGALHDITAPEFFDKKVFSIFVSKLRELGYLDPDAAAREKLMQLKHEAAEMMAPQIRQTILDSVT